MKSQLSRGHSNPRVEAYSKTMFERSIIPSESHLTLIVSVHRDLHMAS